MLAKLNNQSEDSILNEAVKTEELRNIENDVRLRRAQDQKKKYESVDLDKQFAKDFDIFSIRPDLSKIDEDLDNNKNAVPFLFPATEDFLKLAPGRVYLFCAPTGNGKSTLSAAISESFIRLNKNVLVLANEEAESDVRSRVSCIRTGNSFGRFKSNNNPYPKSVVDQIKQDIVDIGEKLIVITSDMPGGRYFTANKDGIVGVIEKNAGKIGCVIIDYYQRVVKTDLNPEANWEAQRELAFELDNLKKIVGCPIIVFAQCGNIQDKKGAPPQESFESSHPRYRWQGSKEIINTATDIIEFRKDYDLRCTHLFAYKARFIDLQWEQNYTLGFNRSLNCYEEFNIAQLVNDISSGQAHEYAQDAEDEEENK